MSTDDGGPPPNATVYARNLSERAKIPALKDALRELFEEYGNIVDIVAKTHVKARGQAFIIFDSVESAQTAIEEIQGFEVLGKPMQLAFAKTRSDATVEREEGEEGLETHQRHRKAEKERKQAVEATQKATKRPAPESLAQRPAKATDTGTAGGAVPDEYLPPNKTLLLRDIPEDYNADMLTTIFRRFAGFKEVRTVPGRANLAFVEYENEEGAITAKESTAGMVLGDKTIRVTFQRQ